MRKRAESQGRGRPGEGVTTATGRQRINGVERHRKEIGSNPGMTCRTSLGLSFLTRWVVVRVKMRKPCVEPRHGARHADGQCVCEALKITYVQVPRLVGYEHELYSG